ncbi:hypothetical protein FRC00_007979, partial [Tulasnella sp. 408]
MQILPDFSRGYSQYDPLKEVPDLKDKVAIVTGGNSGIGYETVKWLAAKGAKVERGRDLRARDESRGKSAVERITESIAGYPSVGSVHWLELDVETPRRAKAGAQRFLAQESRLDILINNAGVDVSPKPDYRTLEGWNAINEEGFIAQNKRY